VDYGAGNVRSVINALEHIGRRAKLTRDAGEIMEADAVILPGVGAFGDAAGQLAASGAQEALLRFFETGRPFLGICVGLQLLFECSQESPGARGLGVLRGEVMRIPAGEGRKVPHMGWNQLELAREDPLFAGLPDAPFFYFVHSYYAKAEDGDAVLARVRYGVPMDVAVRRGNLWAVQFHPEKSGENGLRLLENFAAL
jgi:glutamine amidotransferase